MEVADTSEEKLVTVERHTKFFMIWHWMNFTIGILILISGLEIYYGGPYWNIFGSYHDARALHVLLSIAIAYWSLPVLFYYLSATGDIKDLIIIRGDLAWNTAVLKNFFGLSSEYPEHNIYNVDTKQWYRKYNPGRKFLFWGDVIAIIVSGLTGLAIYWPTTFAPVVSFVDWIGLGGIAGVRSVHYLLTYYFVFTVIGHVYFSLLPVNREELKSIFTGKARSKVHRTSRAE